MHAAYCGHHAVLSRVSISMPDFSMAGESLHEMSCGNFCLISSTMWWVSKHSGDFSISPQSFIFYNNSPYFNQNIFISPAALASLQASYISCLISGLSSAIVSPTVTNLSTACSKKRRRMKTNWNNILLLFEKVFLPN